MVQDGIGHPVRISIDTLTVIFRIRSKFVQILFGTESLNDIVVPIAKDLAPESDLTAFVVSSQSFEHLGQVHIVGLSQRNPALFKSMILVHKVGSLIKFPIVQGLDLISQSLYTLYIVALNMWLLHFIVQLVVVHELVKVKVMSPQIIRKHL